MSKETLTREQEIERDNREKQQAFDRQVLRYKTEVFGGIRYHGASLSKILWRPDRMERLNAFLIKPKNFLVIVSAPGIGKTYFCAALTEWVMKNFDTYRYWKESVLIERLRQGFHSSEGSPKLMQYLIDDKIVILDDVGSSMCSNWKEEVFLDFLDTRYNLTYPTIITSNLTKEEFSNMYHRRVTSRLFASENTVISLDGEQDFRDIGL